MAKHEKKGFLFTANVDPNEYDKAKADKMEQERVATEQKLAEAVKYIEHLKSLIAKKDEKIAKLEASLLSAATNLKWED